MRWMARFRILPLLVVVAALSFGVRFGDFMTGVSKEPGTANAQEQVKEEPVKDGDKEPAKEMADGDKAENSDTMDADKSMEETKDKEERLPTERPDMSEGESINWRDSTEVELENTSIKLELFEDLKVRRKEIERQKRELAVREALLKTAEQELENSGAGA